MTYSLIERQSMAMRLILPKLVSKYLYTDPAQNPSKIFCINWQWKIKRPEQSTQISKKEQKWWSSTTRVQEYKGATIKNVWYLFNNRHISQWNRMKSLEIVPSTNVTGCPKQCQGSSLRNFNK